MQDASLLRRCFLPPRNGDGYGLASPTFSILTRSSSLSYGQPVIHLATPFSPISGVGLPMIGSGRSHRTKARSPRAPGKTVGGGRLASFPQRWQLSPYMPSATVLAQNGRPAGGNSPLARPVQVPEEPKTSRR